MNFDDTESEDDEPQPQEPVEQPAPAAASLLDAQETPDYAVTLASVNGLEFSEETVRTTNVPRARPIKETGEKEAAEERQMKVRHEALKKQGLARTKKRNRDQAAQNMAKPAYERQSMHGQKIAISVGPSSLPDTCRTTWSAIPSKSAKGR